MISKGTRRRESDREMVAGWKVLLGATAFCSSLLFAEAEKAHSGDARTGLASNANFSVLADTQDLAEKISERANVLRKEIADEWMGAGIPDGYGPASINVFFSERNASRTWLIDDAGQRDTHMIWIYTPPDDLDTALAHEIAHVVLANRYADLPAFAHEAIASSYDGEKRREIRANTLKWFAQTDRWPSLKRLFDAERIDASNHSRYTASVSVKDFLLSRDESDRQKFLRFAADGKTNGWDEALARHYGIPSVATCESQWRCWARDQVSSR